MEDINKMKARLDRQKRDIDILVRIMDSSYDGIYITDGEGKTIYINDAFKNISGITDEQALGRTTKEMIEFGFLPKSCSLEVINTLRPVTMIITYNNGRTAMLNGEPVFDDNNKLIRTILNVRDMTELNKVNSELEKAEDKSNSYKRELAEVHIKEQSKNQIIYKSKKMDRVIDMAIKSADVDYPLLIQGESGSGKDVLAAYIHRVGQRSKNGNYIKVNCGAIPENLLESELFGYEKGAFTGALNKGKMGKFELAQGGTFMLDEIGDLPLNLQVKLLDVLQEKTITRIGGIEKIPLNVRIIAATNRDLKKMVSEGKFRLDLYYRLNVLTIYIPPLRERKEDIIPLAKYFLQRENKKMRTKKTLSEGSYDLLMENHWSGNTRELQHVIDRAMITTSGDIIDLKTIDSLDITKSNDKLELKQVIDFGEFINEDLSLKQFMNRVEQSYIERVLDKTNTLKEASTKMNIDISTLVRKKQKYSI